MVPRKLALVLDLDGTLVDSLPDIRRALVETLTAHDRPGLDLPQVRGMLGDGAAALVARALAATGDPGNALEQRAFSNDFLAKYGAISSATTEPFPGVPATLAKLREAGHRLGVCTNKPHDASVQLLHALGLAPLFHAVLGGDAVPSRKPDPAHLWATVRAMGAEGLPTVMVGDAMPDADVARRASVPFVLAAYGYHRLPLDQVPRDATMTSFDQLPALLSRHPWR